MFISTGTYVMQKVPLQTSQDFVAVNGNSFTYLTVMELESTGTSKPLFSSPEPGFIVCNAF